MRKTSDLRDISIAVDSIVRSVDGTDFDAVVVFSADASESWLANDAKQMEAFEFEGPNPASGSLTIEEELDPFSSRDEQDEKRPAMRRGIASVPGSLSDLEGRDRQGKFENGASVGMGRGSDLTAHRLHQ